MTVANRAQLIAGDQQLPHPSLGGAKKDFGARVGHQPPVGEQCDARGHRFDTG